MRNKNGFEKTVQFRLPYQFFNWPESAYRASTENFIAIAHSTAASLEPTNQLAKRNFQPFALALIAADPAAMSHGRKEWPTNMVFGRRFVQSGVQEKRKQ